MTSFQDLMLLGKPISPTFSYFLVNSALLYHFFPEFISSSSENDWKICFPPSFKSWSNNDVTTIPSLLILVSRFCTPPKVKFDAFGTSKPREGKSISKYLFCYSYQYIVRFYRANKEKVCQIHLMAWPFVCLNMHPQKWRLDIIQ